jgi:hypothetical protein
MPSLKESREVAVRRMREAQGARMNVQKPVLAPTPGMRTPKRRRPSVIACSCPPRIVLPFPPARLTS